MSIITDVLDFTKLEVNKQTAQIEAFDLKPLIEDAVAVPKHLLEDKSFVLLVTEFDPRLPKVVSTDPFKLKQMVINLISNAIKFTDKGFVKVKVGCENLNKDHATLKISVQDTGVGIPKDKIDTVFKEFEQIQSQQYIRRYGGMGLGLAICKQFADLLQGKIWVDSYVGQGSTFHIELPIDIIKSGVVPETTESLHHEQKVLKHVKILSVEDNNINQRMMTFMLNNLGYEPDTAKDAEQALEKLAHHAYDIVFMDIQLPDGSGHEITKIVREGHGPNKNTPIIALTAHIFADEQKLFLAAGMNDVVAKPMSRDSLAEAIHLYCK